MILQTILIRFLRFQGTALNRLLILNLYFQHLNQMRLLGQYVLILIVGSIIVANYLYLEIYLFMSFSFKYIIEMLTTQCLLLKY